MSLPGFIVFDDNLPDTPAMLGENNAFTGANTHSGTETFTGVVTTTARNIDVETITSTDTLDATNEVVICNSTSALTVNLPVASGSGRIYTIKNINTGEVTLDGNSSDTIDGDTTQSLYQWDSLTVVDYAANKWIII